MASLRFSVLASGSTGNAFFIETDETRLLVDAGLSGRRIEQLFQQINKDPSDLTGILVTHEHSDHIRGLGVLARKYRLPVYANRKTWQAMDQAIGTLEVGQKFEFEVDQVKTFGDLDVQSFEVSHDAVEPMFFTFHQGDKKVALVTDLGYVSEHIKKTVEDADAYIFEANHDVGMLQMGRYPWNVKRRILSDSGHVSNEDCGYALCDVIGNRTKRIYLAHLSQDNNMKELAQLSVDQILQDHGIRMDLQHTDPKIPTPLYSV